MLLLSSELCQQVQALLIHGVHPQQSFAVVNETIRQLQALPAAPGSSPLAGVAEELAAMGSEVGVFPPSP